MDGLKLLRRWELDCYSKQIPDDESFQEDWKYTISCKEKCVELVVGYHTNGDLEAMDEFENHYNSSEWDQIKQNYFLAYHQVNFGLRQGLRRGSTTSGSR